MFILRFFDLISCHDTNVYPKKLPVILPTGKGYTKAVEKLPDVVIKKFIKKCKYYNLSSQVINTNLSDGHPSMYNPLIPWRQKNEVVPVSLKADKYPNNNSEFWVCPANETENRLRVNTVHPFVVHEEYDTTVQAFIELFKLKSG